MLQRLEMIALPNFPLVEPGDNLVEQIIQSLRDAALKLQHGDLLVIAQKVFLKLKIVTLISTRSRLVSMPGNWHDR